MERSDWNEKSRKVEGRGGGGGWMGGRWGGNIRTNRSRNESLIENLRREQQQQQQRGRRTMSRGGKKKFGTLPFHFRTLQSAIASRRNEEIERVVGESLFRKTIIFIPLFSFFLSFLSPI